ILSLLAASSIGYPLTAVGDRSSDQKSQQLETTQTDDPKPRTDLHGDGLPKGAITRLGTLRFRHGDAIASVAFSPDGKRILSHSFGSIVLWDAPTGKELRRLRAEKGSWFDHCKFAANGRSILILEHAEAKHCIRVRDSTSLGIIREIPV